MAIYKILRIGLPIMLGQACVIILAFADNIMIGWHSVNELAAASFVNNIVNLFIMTEMGFAGGMMPVLAALNGTNTTNGIGATANNVIIVTGIVAVVGLVLPPELHFMFV